MIIAAALKAGPQLVPIAGFDIIIYDDCVEFSMERC